MRDPFFFYLIFFFKIQRLVFLYNFYKSVQFKNLLCSPISLLTLSYQHVGFSTLSFYYYNNFFLDFFFFLNFFRKKSFFFSSKFFKNTTKKLNPHIKKYINFFILRQRKNKKSFNLLTQLRARPEKPFKNFTKLFDKALINFLNKTDTRLFKVKRYKRLIFSKRRLQFLNSDWDTVTRRFFLSMRKEGFIDYFLKLKRKDRRELKGSLNIFDFVFYKKLGVLYYKRYYENVNYCYFQKSKFFFFKSATFFFNYNFYKFLERKRLKLVKRVFFEKDFFYFYDMYMLFFTNNYFFLKNYNIKRFKFSFLFCVDFNFLRFKAEVLAVGFKNIEFLEKKKKRFFKFFFFKKKFFFKNFDETDLFLDVNLDSETVAFFKNRGGLLEVEDSVLTFFLKKKNIVKISGNAAETNVNINEVDDSSTDEVDDSSIDEVDDSSIDEVNDSSIDEVDDGTIVKIDSGDIVKVDGNSVSETSSNSADGTDGDFSFNLNVVKKIKKKSFENENEDENMIFFPQKQMGLELDYLNSIFFFFKKFKRYFLLNILLKRRIFNVFSKKNFNNIYLYNFITFFPEDFLFSFYNFDFFSQHPKNFQLLKYTNMSLLNNFVSIKTNTPISETEHRTRVINMYQKICGYNIYVLFFLNLLELKFKKKVFFKIINIYKYFRKHKVYSFYRHIFKKLGYFKFKIRKYFNFHETFKILYMSILFKDATLFMNWVTWVMRRIQYRSTKQFLYFLKSFLLKYLLPTIGAKTGLLGFFFDIRGKVGVAGDSKKRHVCIVWGKPSYTTKNYKFVLKQGLVPTFTGVMGVTVVMTF